MFLLQSVVFVVRQFAHSTPVLLLFAGDWKKRRKKISNDGIATRGNNFETDHTTHLGVRTSRVRRTTHAVVLFAVGFY